MQTASASHELAPLRSASTATDTVLRWALALASIGAAAIHFGFAPAHLDVNSVHGAFFLTVAWFQLAWGIAVALRPSTLLLRLGVLANVGILGVWVVSRTVGIDGEVEGYGFPDVAASVLEGAIVVGAVAYLVGALSGRSIPSAVSGAMLGALTVAVAAAASASMLPSVAGDHGAGGHHGAAGETAAAGDGHAEGHADGHEAPAGTAGAVQTATAADDDHEVVEAVPFDPKLPIDLGGTVGVTPEQQAEAENLVAVTLLQLPQWSDPAVAEAAGFRSIGDGGTGTEHFLNQEFIDDDVILDPNRPESLVFDTSDGGRRLAAAMYMVSPGTPLEDVPDLGGKLMQWHIHDNLCYNAEGRVAGITDDEGNCKPGLRKPKETPMIHVWIEPHPCGPFAALEGIGAGSIKEGEERLCDEAHGAHGT